MKKKKPVYVVYLDVGTLGKDVTKKIIKKTKRQYKKILGKALYVPIRNGQSRIERLM